MEFVREDLGKRYGRHFEGYYETYILIDGKKEGPCKTYYKTQQLWKICYYNSDRIEGPYEAYHENGQLKETVYYVLCSW